MQVAVWATISMIGTVQTKSGRPACLIGRQINPKNQIRSLSYFSTGSRALWYPNLPLRSFGHNSFLLHDIQRKNNRFEELLAFRMTVWRRLFSLPTKKNPPWGWNLWRVGTVIGIVDDFIVSASHIIVSYRIKKKLSRRQD